MAVRYLPDAASCQCCGVGFGMLTWLKHCKACGASVCDDCSQTRTTLPFHREPKRVCDHCQLSALLDQAVCQRRPDEVRRLLAQLPVDRPTLNGGTVLDTALIGGHPEVVAAVIEAGPALGRLGPDGLTPLARAARTGKPEVVQLLLEAKASPESAAPDFSSPVVEAAAGGHQAALQLLLDHKAKPDHGRKDGRSALLWAVHEDRTTELAMLCQAGADPTAEGPGGESALELSCRLGDQAVTEQLLRCIELHGRPDQTRVLAACRAACTAGAAGCLRAALRHAELSQEPGDQPGCLHLAAGHTELVRALLEANAGCELPRPGDGKSPLMLAAEHRAAEPMRLLLEAGADPNRLDSEGSSALLLLLISWLALSSSSLAEQLNAAKCVTMLVEHPNRARSPEMPNLNGVSIQLLTDKTSGPVRQALRPAAPSTPTAPPPANPPAPAPTMGSDSFTIMLDGEQPAAVSAATAGKNNCKLESDEVWLEM